MIALALLCGGAGRGEAMRPEGVMNSPLSRVDSATPVAADYTLEAPEDDFSLRISFLPEGEGSPTEAGYRLWWEKFPGMALAGGRSQPHERMRLSGKAQMAADYRPTETLAMKFTYENRLRPGGAETAERLNSNLGYELKYSPSAQSSLTAAWKWLKNEEGRNIQDKQSVDLGYELKFDGGVMRLGRKTLVSSTNGKTTSRGESSLHTEWGRDNFSLAADWLQKEQPNGTQETSKLAGKYEFSKRLAVDVGWLKQRARNNDKTKTELRLAADLGKKGRPLKLKSRLVRGEHNAASAALSEFSLRGGFDLSDVNVKFAAKLREQQGKLDGKAGGSLRDWRLETKYERLRLMSRQESFTAESGRDRQKAEFEAGYALSDKTEIFWQSKRQAGAAAFAEEAVGVRHNVAGLEFGLEHEEQAKAAAGQAWETAKVAWKDDTPLPEWAQGMGERGIFDDNAKFGFEKSPVWAKAAGPGVEFAWRNRRGEGAKSQGSLRLIYRGMLSGIHLRAGHEDNPWQARGGKEKVAFGRRRFLEAGLPVSKKLTGLVRLSQNDGLAQTTEGLFVAVGGKLSGTEKFECFFSTEAQWQNRAAIDASAEPLYGVLYSRRKADEHYIVVKAALNPPADGESKFGDYRVDVEYAKPF